MKYAAPGIQMRRQRYYGIKEIPKDLQGKLGKARFVQTLGTDHLPTAKRRYAILRAQWEQDIANARNEPPEDDALYWRRQLEKARNPRDRQRVLQTIELASEVPAVFSHAPGVEPADQVGAMDAAYERSKAFYEQATGQRVRLVEHLDDWVKDSGLADRTKVAAIKDITRFAAHHPDVQSITRREVQTWVNILSHGPNGLGPGTIKKRLAFLRSYWKWLQHRDLAPEGRPFADIDVPKKNGRGQRRPFTVEDIRRLIDRSDGDLHHLIILAAHTGMRIEEICSMKIEDVTAEAFTVTTGKTAAAARSIPIHRDIEALVKQLKTASTDGYLLSGQAVDKHGYRSNPLGQRFSKFKSDLGYDERYVFHSLRMAVATMLEEGGIQEVVAARLLGHALKTMSYGVYSGGPSLEVKRKALEKAIRIFHRP